MVGPVEEGDANRLRAAVAKVGKNGDPTYRSITLSMDSPGGPLDPAIELANTIRNIGIATHVGAGKRCLSGCAIAFMAGTWLDGDDTKETNRTLHPMAQLGFHAPFVFTDSTDVDPAVAALLLPDAERGGSIAASKLVKLSLAGVLPTSLVESLLQYEARRFLYVDTVDRAGRWQIPLENAQPMRLENGIVEKHHRKRLSAHCNNVIQWRNDVAFEDRDVEHSLPDNSLIFDGMDNGCSYEPNFESETVSYSVNGEFGSVLYWQTLPADTKLDQISSAQLEGVSNTDDPFASPPPSQIDGQCVDGYQWIGGWAGSSFQDSIAHATYRSCETTKSFFFLECRHGQGTIETFIDLREFGAENESNVRITTQVDDNYELGSGGAIVTDRGLYLFKSSLTRDYFTFNELKKGGRLIVSVNEVRRKVHLSGSRQAIEAMEASCL